MEKDPENLINKKVKEMKGKNLTIGGPVIMKEKNREAQRLIGELESLKISIKESTANIENLEKEKGEIKTKTLEIGKEQERIKIETLEIREELNEVRIQKEKQKGELEKKKKELEETKKLKKESGKQETEPVTEIKKPVEIKTEPIKEEPPKIVVEEKKNEVKEPETKTEIPPEEGKVISIPLMITRRMRQQLAGLGWNKEEQGKLTPEKAQKIIAEQQYFQSEQEAEKILKGYTPLAVEDISKLKVGDKVIEVNVNYEGGIVKKRVEKDEGVYFILSGPGIISRIEKGKSISEIVKAEEIEPIKKKRSESAKEEDESKYITVEEMVKVGTEAIGEEEVEKKPEIVEEKKEEPPKIIVEEKKEPEKEKTTEEQEKEIPLETKLNEAREKYATGYKQFMAERKQKSAWYTNLKRKVFGSKVKEGEVPENLKNLEKDYDQMLAKFGKDTYAKKKLELAGSKLSKEEQEKELTKYFHEEVAKEQKKLSDSKIEKLPPKEKSIVRKSIDWYLKRPRYQKILISAALTTAIASAFATGAIAAAGGTGFYFGTKLVRGATGALIGKGASKAYDLLIREKFTKRKEEEEVALAKKFEGKENISEEDFGKYIKEYFEVLEREQKAKVNRTIHKAMITVAAAGLSSWEMGHELHYLSPEQVLSGEEIHEAQPGSHRINISDQMREHEAVDHPKTGTEGEITEGTENQPEIGEEVGKGTGIQDFMKTNATQDAINFGMYNPGATAESLNVQSGTISFEDASGNRIEVPYSSNGAIQTIENLKAEMAEYYGGIEKVPQGTIDTHFIDMKGVAHDQVLIKGDSVEQIKNADMFDSDKNVTQATTSSAGATTDHPVSDEIITPKPVHSDISTIGTEENITSPTEDNIVEPKPVGQTETPIEETPDQASSQNTDLGENTAGAEAADINSPIKLSPEEILTQTNKEYADIIDHIFTTKESLATWTSNIGVSHGMAYTILNMQEDIAPAYKPLQSVMMQLHELTGIEPTSTTALVVGDTPEEYLKMTIKYAEENNIDLSNLEY